MPKRMSVFQVNDAAHKKAELMMMANGVGNAKRIVLAAYRWLKREEKRQKEATSKGT